MKKSFLAILLMASFSFSFSTPELNPENVASPTEKTFNSYGTVTLVDCDGANYYFSLSHASDPQVTKFSLIIDGVDSGRKVTVGGTFYVPRTHNMFALTYPSAEFPIIYAAGVMTDYSDECTVPANF